MNFKKDWWILLCICFGLVVLYMIIKGSYKDDSNSIGRGTDSRPYKGRSGISSRNYRPNQH